MGGCFSDVSGGKQAIGGGGTQPQQQMQSSVGGGGHNDAVDFFFKTKGLDALFTQIELSFSASKLRDRDIMSKSDPMLVVHAKKRDGSLAELGRTEVIMNNLNPIWIGNVPIAYQFEIVQPLVFHVYDVDTKYHNLPVKELKLKDQEFLGEASCVLSEIVTKQSRSLTLNLYNKHGPGLKNFGTITVHAEETAASRNAVEVVFRCMHLDNKDLFSKSDPFLRISRIVEAGGSVPICKTEIVNNNLNPVWKPLCLSMRQYGSKDNPLIIECFDFNSSGDHILIGQLQKSVADFERIHREKVGVNFILPSSHHRHEKVLKGQLFVDGFVEKQLYSFIDYISSGFELNFMVAVDFTASNGHPRTPSSLHYIDPSGRLNAYQQAIIEVGDVIQFYDSDRRFPAWGFGGKTHDGLISHCFNLNGSPSGFEVEGVEGIMAAYASALQNVTLSGPTLFSQVINRAADLAGQSLSYNSSKYFVLLIITDGVLTDLQETKDAIIKASDLPLSILIVGVGNADFKQMEILDADNGHRLESSAGRIATRDIVQFVSMRDVHGGQISVVQSLLEELPGQFLTYMRSRDIKPIGASVPQSTYPP
ncbi:putative C2 domain, von Willebrand factor, type A, copine, protein BONZAI [Heracleum sosnowskyi]|uniref:C2 domain, von Willebrand factor, type A, copine, protein BONZAI n=1 Tax=Heracleum sosnowskyi TaxID=360622 RepID=A0AAD8H4T5_9APIA|nr:putative C2 domain, von Willebrand factor, type A, copine, protein BONZAI [Heracleum sosnowskyi]